MTMTTKTCGGTLYNVTWRVEVLAASPMHAARKARDIQLDPESDARFFEVDGEELCLGHQKHGPALKFRDLLNGIWSMDYYTFVKLLYPNEPDNVYLGEKWRKFIQNPIRFTLELDVAKLEKLYQYIT